MLAPKTTSTQKEETSPEENLIFKPSESFLNTNTSCTCTNESYWKPVIHIPHVSNFTQSLLSNDSSTICNSSKSMIEKQRKSERLLLNKITGRISSSESLSNISPSNQPLFTPFKDCERKPPSIKEERRRARARNQKLLFESIRNMGASDSTTAHQQDRYLISVRRVLNFEN